MAALATAFVVLDLIIPMTRACEYCLGSISQRMRDMFARHSTACCRDAHSFLLVYSPDTLCHTTSASTPSTMAMKVMSAQITVSLRERWASTMLAATNGNEVASAKRISSLAHASCARKAIGSEVVKIEFTLTMATVDAIPNSTCCAAITACSCHQPALDVRTGMSRKNEKNRIPASTTPIQRGMVTLCVSHSASSKLRSQPTLTPSVVTDANARSPSRRETQRY
mmetsp:Transcript_32438/g.79103  ORF Transcript_32438/g.79103 Transcript_32438/m.79103 type:complete len:225 (-) Transcript_32438:2135-2809(-)